MKMKEVEALTGLSRANIRFYESKGLLEPVRGDNNYRDYTQEDVTALQKIVLLRKLGISIEHIQRLFEKQESFAEVLEQTKSELSRQIEELNGALELCSVMISCKEELDTLDIHKYQSIIEEQERQGKRFLDILVDYRQDIVKNTYNISEIKGSLILGVIAYFVLGGVICVIFSFTLTTEHDGSWLYDFLMPAVGFLIVSAAYVGDRLIKRTSLRTSKVLHILVLGLVGIMVILYITGIALRFL